MQKIVTVGIFALVAMLLVATTMSSFNAVDAKKPTKAVKCNNVKVQIKVNGVEANETVVASATIGKVALTKTSIVDENETSIVVPLNFKKINPCPAIGSEIFGDVNGTGFTSELNSLKKPNRVSVTLP